MTVDAGINHLRFSIWNTAGLSGPWPVTGGVPIAEGQAPAGSLFALRDASGAPVPLQADVTARWPDGSARWVLLDFQAVARPDRVADYVLSWGSASSSVLPADPVRRHDEPAAGLTAGQVAVTGTGDALLDISGRWSVDFQLTGSAGESCRTVVESCDIETAGPLRGTLALRGVFVAPDGRRVFGFRLRVTTYAGLPLIRVEPMILVDTDAGILQQIRSLNLSILPRGGARAACLGGSPGWEGAVTAAVRLFQCDDQCYRMEGTADAGCRAPGWAAIRNEHGAMSVAVRDFWQQWPKSLEVSPAGVSVGLFPRFIEGDYDHMQPWYKHQYLFAGECYRLRTGQARRWDLWLDLEGRGEELAAMACAPLVPSADPAQALATTVWGAIAPAGTREMQAYDAWAEDLCKAYQHAIEVDRDYGAMNWGDWFGERQVNWGNHEYDTTDQLLVQFARTGDPRYFYAADAAARHSTEVDTVHSVNPELADYFLACTPIKYPGFPPRPGMVHAHALGHVGGFYPLDRIEALFVEKRIEGDNPHPHLCLEPFHVCHIFVQGIIRQYGLTGDPFLKETALRICDNLARLVEDRQFQFMNDAPHCGRTTGWPLLALAAAYELDGDPRYLQAMRTLVDDALARQDPNCGGWLYSLGPGHCHCRQAKHVGMAGFITAVLINGLSRYYRLSGDGRLPSAIERAVTFLNNDTWREEWRDWRYTSCPATGPIGQDGVVIMALVNSVAITRNPEHLRILRLAWEAKFDRLLATPIQPGSGQGKKYSSTMYGCPEAIALLAEEGRLSS